MVLTVQGLDFMKNYCYIKQSNLKRRIRSMEKRTRETKAKSIVIPSGTKGTTIHITISITIAGNPQANTGSISARELLARIQSENRKRPNFQ
jgi:hypothetical protein